MLLAISKWLSWVVEPPSGSSDEAANEGHSLSTVSLERLMQLGLRLRESTPLSGSCHQLLRFNLYNLGDDPVTVSAVALSDTAGQKLQCEVVPPVVVQAGVRYPFMFELRTALGSEAVEIHVEGIYGQRAWVQAPALPGA